MALKNVQSVLKPFLNANGSCLSILFHKLHVSASNYAWSGGSKEPKHFLSYNDKIYPPQSPDEPRRPAFICHQRCNIKYSPKKMWYIACLIRGMAVDEAIKQLKFSKYQKGAIEILETIEEAKELAVKDHNVEFASNLWVSESMIGKAGVIKGMRRHARSRFGLVEYKYIHYFLTLEEGKPPKHYYAQRPKEPHEQLGDWLEQMRKRKIINSL